MLEVRSLKILLTGGTGFFGKSILRSLFSGSRWQPAIESLSILSRDPESFLDLNPEFRGLPGVRFYRGDILRPETLPKSAHLTHVIHCAADSTQGARLQPLERYVQIVEGTRHLLDFSKAVGVRRFLLASSGAVYGPQSPLVDQIEEHCLGMPDPLMPGNAYGVGKRAAEHLCALYQEAEGIECVIARCFAFVGADLPLNVHFAIGNFLQDAMAGRPICIRGDGSPYRSYLYQEDLAEWLFTLLSSGSPGSAYNLGSDRAVTLLELARLIRDLVAPGLEIRVEGEISDTMRNRYIPSIEKARSELGLDVTVELPEAIRKTFLELKNRET